MIFYLVVSKKIDLFSYRSYLIERKKFIKNIATGTAKL